MLLQRASRPGAQPCGGARKAVRVRFVKLPGLFKHVPLLPVFSSPPQHAVDAEQAQTSRLDSLLERAAESTFHAPDGQLFGRAGRRCTLEDGERMLELYIQERPRDLQARVLLLRNLMRQALGRERDVPYLALRALRESGVSGCDASSGRYVQVLQIVLLALKALAKLEAEGASIPRNPEHPLLSADSFLDGAAAAVPGMADDMRGLARRLGRQLGGCNPDSRRRLLAQRDEYMSCVDLSFVSGQHHAGGGGGALNPREPEQQEL